MIARTATLEVENEVIEVQAPGGRRLYSTLRRVPRARGLLILLPAGLKFSAGPHRLNLKIALALQAMGWCSALVDPGGYGDSEGTLPGGTTHSIWRSIESGALVDDIVVVARELKSRFPEMPLYVCGLCGGAISALVAAARAPDIFDGVIALSLAVQVTPNETSRTPLLSPTFARRLLSAYAQRASSIEAWKRVLQGEVKLSGPFRAAVASVRYLVWPRSGDALAGLNIIVRDALRTLGARRTPHLLVFGSSDRRHPEFVDASACGLWAENRKPESCVVEVVADANHEFHFPQWQQSAFQAIRDWTELQLASRRAGPV